ncbi:MAG: hypothetical protein NW205_05660 [Hyphomicrobiaceae bacterium]|nr:hypothetical protein [Hyphomicrobiaceae bacterium]
MPQQPVAWGTEAVANTVTPASQWFPAVTALAGGGFVVMWEDTSQSPDAPNGTALRGQVFDALGAPVGSEFLVATFLDSSQTNVDVAGVAGGGFVATWTVGGHPGDANTSGIIAQRFSPTGQKIGGEIVVNTVVDPATDFSQTEPVITALDSGGFAIAYVVDQGGANEAAEIQRFDANGVKIGGPITANSGAVDNVQNFDIAATGGNSFVLVWQDASGTSGDASGSAVNMSLYEDDGTPILVQAKVNGPTLNDQQFPTVAGDGAGGFIVAYRDFSGDINASLSLVATTFGTTGVKITSEFLVNDPLLGSGPAQPSIARLGDGTYFIGWNEFLTGSGYSYGLLLADDTTPIGDQITVNSVSTDPDAGGASVAALADGRIVFVWNQSASTGPDTSDQSIRFQILDPRAGLVTGTDNSETITGSFTGSAIVNDTIDAGDGSDTVYGFDGDDTINSGFGNDTMYGGTGNDTYMIDDVDDLVVELPGEGSNDTVMTTFTYTLTANVETGRLVGANPANLTGNGGNNTLTGNEAANTLMGMAGNDTLIGGGDIDLLMGGTGIDTLNGGDGNDIINGGNGRDLITGGAGADDFDYNARNETGRTAASRDRIFDFLKGVDDIDLRGIDAKSGTAKNDAFTFIGTRAFSGEKGELHIVRINKPMTANDRTLIEGDINGDGRADFQIELIGLKSLSAADFLL